MPTPDETADDRLAREAHVNVIVAANRFSDGMERICREEGITEAQYVALWVLCLGEDPAAGVPIGAIADGLLTSLGDKTFPIIRQHVKEVITVSDDEIVAAMRLVWERAKLIIEPSSAVAVAATMTEAFRALDGIRRVGVVISGGNVDLDNLPWQLRHY